MFKPGEQIGRYRVIRAFGSGNPDGLFEVEDEAKRRFVLRSPLADIDDSGSAVTQRFLPEAEALRSLVQLNLVPLFDVFVDKGYLCMVMEQVRGRTLRAAIDDGQIGPRQALVITRQMLSGAAHAHAAGHIHRDLQPSKVLMVAMEGWELIKVAGFGLGALHDEAVLEFGNGALTGSVRKPNATYMAPEQVRGRSVDGRTDLYAVGVMLYEVLAGRAPFPDNDPQLVMSCHLSVPPPKLDELCKGADWCTPQVLSLVETALAKEREERFSNAQQMIGAVEAAFASIQHLPPE